MTNREAYLAVKRILTKAGKESPAFDAACLCTHFLGLDRPGLAVHGAEQADNAPALLEAARRRAAGEPLQYLVGKWGFLNLDLAVGPGVLCPRAETELLVRTAAAQLQPSAAVLDLCAGTGAVGLGVSSLRPDVRVTCGEKFDAAFAYLAKNCAAYPELGVTPCRLEAFSAADAAAFGPLDGFLCNPPYVKSGEIPGLQQEVRQEPWTALDGGGDGLRFYRAIATLWLPRLAPGGFAAVEIGEDQGPAVSALFCAAGLSRVCVSQDLDGFDRVVCGVNK